MDFKNSAEVYLIIWLKKNPSSWRFGIKESYFGLLTHNLTSAMLSSHYVSGEYF